MRYSRSIAIVLSVASQLLTGAELLAAPPAARERVQLERVPSGGIQPQVQVSADGTVHLLYYTGADGGGDVQYVFRGPDESTFSAPRQVNSGPASAIAAGSIRSAQLAVGGDGVVHVAWNGSHEAKPKGPGGELPLLYSRLVPGHDAFEPERNLITSAYGLDGGACIAADRSGNVYVAWHAGPGQEDSRRVWLVQSSDSGQTFSEERAIDDGQSGACGCCSMAGTASPTGEVMFLYRSAFEDVHRDMYLLASEGPSQPVVGHKLHEWTINACPMSSAAFAHHGEQSWAAWESAEQVYLGNVSAKPSLTQPVSPAGRADHRKHPRVAVNGRGEVLLTWTEGTGWKRGGRLAWQLYAADGQPIGNRGSAAGVPVWSFPAAYARADGEFVILY